jgi:hypothetical protein
MMMNDREIWVLASKAMRAFPRHYEECMETAARKHGLASPNWMPLIMTYTFKPDPISVDRLRVRSPYTAPRYYNALILHLHERGFFARSPLGGFVLSSLGVEAFQTIMDAAYAGMQAIPLLSSNDMQMLTRALGRLVQACLTYGEPISRWSLIYSRRLDESPAEAWAAKIDQYLSDLAAFRDDAHLASWIHYHVNGHSWDVLTQLWREGSMPIEAISDRLARQHWTREETSQAADELRKLGWVDGSQVLSITDLGREIRQHSETLTDTYFFAPWRMLVKDDLENLWRLLPQLYKLLASK